MSAPAITTWVRRTSGWGTTEYTTTVDGVRYIAKKTGGRFISWEVRVDEIRGARITSGGTLRSLKEGFDLLRERGLLAEKAAG